MILVVDDSHFWARTLQESLRAEGFEVEAMEDCLAAAQRIRTDPPEILITDYFLANLDGAKLCRLAKSVTQGAARTIILTGGADRRLSRSLSSAADVVIAKNRADVVLEDLRQVLDGLLSAGVESGGRLVGHERLAPRSVTSKLHGLKRYLEALHDGVGDAVIGVDDQLRVYFLNSTACALFEVAEETVVATPLTSVFNVDEDHHLIKTTQRVLRSGERTKPFEMELENTFLRVSAAGLTSADDRATALVVARDVTDLRAAEEERISLIAQLHQADKMAALGQLTAGISHEINNPLAAILPNLKTLQDSTELLLSAPGLGEYLARGANDDVREAAEEMPGIIEDCAYAADRIRSITREMCQFAHPNRGNGERVQIEDLLESALCLASSELRFKARVVREYGKTRPVVVDPTKMSQAFVNILLNAAQALDESGAGTHWVRVLTRERHDGVEVRIANSGPPIPKEVQSRIFEPFYTTKEVGKGTGLGLSITYDSVRRHGGTIEVRSEPDQPTVFTLWFPWNTGVSTKSEVADRVEERVSGRVLIVDDEKILRRSFRRILADQHEVMVVSNAERALALLAQGERFDVLLCDLIMPGMSGMDFFYAVQRQWPELAARFVFLTGGTFSPEAREFLTQVENMRAFKPLDSNQLKQLVARCLVQFADVNAQETVLAESSG